MRDTQRFVGTPADRLIVKPKDANDAAGLKAFRTALGVPETADKYELPVPDGQDPKFANWAREKFLARGVPADIAKGIAEDWNGFLAGEMAAGVEADKLALAAADTTLKKDWGVQFDANRELARRAFTHYVDKAGLSDAAAHLETAMGIPSVVRLFHAIAAAGGESTFRAGEGAPATLTPQSAQVRLAALRSDRDWVKGYTGGDLNKQLEFHQLNAIITGDDSALKIIQAKIAKG